MTEIRFDDLCNWHNGTYAFKLKTVPAASCFRYVVEIEWADRLYVESFDVDAQDETQARAIAKVVMIECYEPFAQISAIEKWW